METTATEIIDRLFSSAQVEEGVFEDLESSEVYVGQLTYKLLASLERIFNRRRDIQPIYDSIKLSPDGKYAVWYETSTRYQGHWGLRRVA